LEIFFRKHRVRKKVEEKKKYIKQFRLYIASQTFCGEEWLMFCENLSAFLALSHVYPIDTAEKCTAFENTLVLLDTRDSCETENALTKSGRDFS
jgi:hypothetical protein